jgi:very-short-patch-repair endonuclease
LSSLVTAVDLDANKRFENGEDFIAQPFNTQFKILQSWQDTSGLRDIMNFNVAANVCVTEGLDQVVSVAENWPDAGTNLIDVFEQSWFESILGNALKERPALLNFDGTTHEQAIEQFQRLDTLALEHNRSRVAYAHWSKIPRHDSGGQLGVLKRQFQLKRRHLPIRQLMIQAGNAVQAIKPVFMMSPLSIASYLAPGSLNFDLVVFDEASQVRPVDALGAILRSQQAVVVGDTQQLPPTNFFNSMTQLDDDSALADLESILGLFLAQNAPDRMLRWHYRSRHESLIAVSNREFYKNELVIFPSPDAEKSEVGLIYHHLEDTVYERGRGASNPKEAQIVAEAVMKHAHESPEMSLGVAAFSMAQMTAILDRVELLRRKDTSVEQFFSSHPEEPFFVKNLENVQGDERDVMFISVGYGRDSTGRLDMNFGPLNNDGGERRLNVLITRAKSRCEVFTNLSADDIDLGRSQSRGVQAFKSFLAFAERGELSEIPSESGRIVDSPFQNAVAAQIAALGYDVRQEIGTGGYYIDLAIVDPDQPGRYVIGIECDGASYHSARSARDRDRLREAVLNNLGWRIHHIWSTDWFHNPERELKKTVEAIEQAKIYQTKKPKTPTQVEQGAPPINRTEADNETTRVEKIPDYVMAQIKLATRGHELHEIPISRISEAVVCKRRRDNVPVKWF